MLSHIATLALHLSKKAILRRKVIWGSAIMGRLLRGKIRKVWVHEAGVECFLRVVGEGVYLKNVWTSVTKVNELYAAEITRSEFKIDHFHVLEPWLRRQ